MIEVVRDVMAKDGKRPICFTISVCQVMFWLTWICVWYFATHGADEPAFRLDSSHGQLSADVTTHQ